MPDELPSITLPEMGLPAADQSEKRMDDPSIKREPEYGTRYVVEKQGELLKAMEQVQDPNWKEYFDKVLPILTTFTSVTSKPTEGNILEEYIKAFQAQKSGT